EFWNALRKAATGHELSAFSTARGARTGPVADVLESGVTDIAPPNALPSGAAVVPQAADSMRGSAQPAPVKKSAVGLLAVLGVLVIAAGGSAVWFTRKPNGGSAANGATVSTVSSLAGASAARSAGAGADVRPLTCPPGMKPIDGGEFYMGSDE